MENIHRVTYALVALLLVTAIFSVATSGTGNKPAVSHQAIGDQQPETQEMQRHLAAIKAFPTVDYDEAEPSDPIKRASTRVKQQRHNNFSMVAKTPQPHTGEINFTGEDLFDFPGLPVERSDVIVLGEVLAGDSHMSENRRNVFSDFTVKVEKTVKSVIPKTPISGSQISIERIGGNIKYPNGQTVLYRGAGFGAPRVGGRYVFFLSSIPQSNDYTILTGYELSEKGIEPLDFSPQFEAFRGFDVPTFLSTLDEMLTKSSTR